MDVVLFVFYSHPVWCFCGWRSRQDTNWHGVLTNIDINANLYSYAGAGGWNDPCLLLAEEYTGTLRQTQLQTRAQFSMWAIMASPLLISANVRRCPPPTPRPPVWRTPLNPPPPTHPPTPQAYKPKCFGFRTGTLSGLLLVLDSVCVFDIVVGLVGVGAGGADAACLLLVVVVIVLVLLLLLVFCLMVMLQVRNMSAMNMETYKNKEVIAACLLLMMMLMMLMMTLMLILAATTAAAGCCLLFTGACC